MAHNAQRRCFHETTVAVGPREKNLRSCCCQVSCFPPRRSRHCGFVRYFLRSCCWHKGIVSTKPQWLLARVRKNLRSFCCRVLFSSATQSPLWFRELFLEELLVAQGHCFYETAVAVGPREKQLEELLLPSIVLLPRHSRHCGFVNYFLRSICLRARAACPKSAHTRMPASRVTASNARQRACRRSPLEQRQERQDFYFSLVLSAWQLPGTMRPGHVANLP